MTEHAKANDGGTCVEDASTRSFSSNPENNAGSKTTQEKPKTLPPNAPDGIGYLWFPMYVRYRQELKVQEELEKNDFKTFIPMEKRTTRRKGRDMIEMKPAIHNMIFVFSNQSRITWMKMHNMVCTKMQYMSFRAPSDGTSTVITVPLQQMENIMRAAMVDDPDGLRSYCDAPVTSDPAKVGREIEFIDGPFAGVRGIIKRVDKNRVMLIHLPQNKCIKIRISRAQDINYL
jgi:transcription antitermination factor NusG